MSQDNDVPAMKYQYDDEYIPDLGSIHPIWHGYHPVESPETIAKSCEKTTGIQDRNAAMELVNQAARTALTLFSGRASDEEREITSALMAELSPQTPLEGLLISKYFRPIT